MARAQTSSSTALQSRYFFDYLQAQQDISAVVTCAPAVNYLFNYI
nr:hypothetical protein [Klebsiella michiganensis]